MGQGFCPRLVRSAENKLLFYYKGVLHDNGSGLNGVQNYKSDRRRRRRVAAAAAVHRVRSAVRWWRAEKMCDTRYRNECVWRVAPAVVVVRFVCVYIVVVIYTTATSATTLYYSFVSVPIKKICTILLMYLSFDSALCIYPTDIRSPRTR